MNRSSRVCTQEIGKNAELRKNEKNWQRKEDKDRDRFLHQEGEKKKRAKTPGIMHSNRWV